MLASEDVKLELEGAEAGLYPKATKLSILFHVKPSHSHLTSKPRFPSSRQHAPHCDKHVQTMIKGARSTTDSQQAMRERWRKPYRKHVLRS